MKLEELTALSPDQPIVASPEVFQQIGTIPRLLHDTLQQLGVMPQLKVAADGLPDARSRLTYIANKTADAANKVLNSVDQAKADHAHISNATRELAAALVADPVRAVASGKVMNFVQDVEASTARIDGHLTDIMLAQDFHDLTGQVIARVVTLAGNIEQQLVQLVIETAPPHAIPAPPEPKREHLAGPVVDPEGNPDVVTDQSQVDDLLASLGF